MNKVSFLVLVSIIAILMSNVLITDGISAGCPLIGNFCTKYCRRGNFGRKGKCIGKNNSECKCYV
uniref:AKTx n=1 Tax=Hadrurus spadix TaxID=141984 RepID=A0A1W7RB44_9SCOR